jgi:hypothetical protein
MMQVRQYLTDLTGSRLYEKIYSRYGPVYFFYNWLVRSATVSVAAGRMQRDIPAPAPRLSAGAARPRHDVHLPRERTNRQRKIEA